MSRMFSCCSSLKEINLSSFNTNKVTNMSYMFENCSSLEKLDLSSFNTNQVTNMSDMFYSINKKCKIKCKDEKIKMECYNLLLDLLEVYNIKLLSGKVYWEKTEEKEKYKKFLEQYEKSETAKAREILFLKREISCLPSTIENAEIIKFYKERLLSFGAIKKIKNSVKNGKNYVRSRKIK